MFAVIRVGVGLMAVIAVGWFATSLTSLKLGHSHCEKTALWFLFGTGLMSIVPFCVSLIAADCGLSASWVLAAASLAAVLLEVYRRRRDLLRLLLACAKPTIPRRAKPFAWLKIGLLLALGAAVCCIAVITFATGLGWDGVAIWSLKARIFFLEGGVNRLYFHDLSRQWSHLDYPLLVPLTEAWLYSILGNANEELIKALFLSFYVSLLCLFCAALRRHHNLSYSLGFALLLCLTPAMLTMGTSGYADLPIAVFVFGGTAYLYFWFSRGNSKDLLLAGLLSASAMWTKREGLVTWLLHLASVVMWIAFASRQPASFRLRSLLRFSLPAALLVPWLLFLAREQVPSNDFAPLTLQGFLGHLGRLPILARMLLAQLFSVPNWGILWGLFLAAALFPSPRVLSAPEVFLFLFPIAYLLLMTGSYVLSLWNPFEVHVLGSIDRLVLQVVPVATFFVAQRVGRGLAAFAPASADQVELGDCTGRQE